MEIIVYSELWFDKIDYPNWERIISVSDSETRKQSIYIKNNWKWNSKQIIQINKDKVDDLIEWLKKITWIREN